MAPFYVLQTLWEVGYPPLPSQSWRWSCHLFASHLGPLFAWFATFSITQISSKWQLAPFYRTGTIYLSWTMKKLMWTIHIGYKNSICVEKCSSGSSIACSKAGGRTSRLFYETRQVELQRKNGRYIAGGRRLRTWYMHVRRMYEKVVLNLVHRNWPSGHRESG